MYPQEAQNILQKVKQENLMEYSHTSNNNQNQVAPQTMQLGYQRQTSYSNHNNQSGRGGPLTHRQGECNTAGAFSKIPTFSSKVSFLNRPMVQQWLPLSSP